MIGALMERSVVVMLVVAAAVAITMVVTGHVTTPAFEVAVEDQTVAAGGAESRGIMTVRLHVETEEAAAVVVVTGTPVNGGREVAEEEAAVDSVVVTQVVEVDVAVEERK